MTTVSYNIHPREELMEEFHCLWDPGDPAFDDKTIRAKAYERLNERYTAQGYPMDLVTLKLRTATFHRSKIKRRAMSVCVQCIKKSEDIALLLPEFPCLWDFHDLNYSDETVKAHCRAQLLEKYNKTRAEKIGMVVLSSKLDEFNQNRLECSRKSKTTVKKRYTKQPATRTRKMQTHDGPYFPDEQMTKLLRDYPCLWNHKDPEYLIRVSKACAREQLLERYNAVARVKVDMTWLKSKLGTRRYRQRMCGQKSPKRPRVETTDFIKQFPCLADPQDPSFHDLEEKDLARKQLLEKYNAVASEPIDMKKMCRRIQSYLSRISRARPSEVTTGNSEDSQNSQPCTNSDTAETLLEDSENLPNENLTNSDNDMDSNSETDIDDREMKFDPVSVTDTEFVKQSINVCVRETNEGKRRVYVDLSSCFSLSNDNRYNHNESNFSVDFLPEKNVNLTNEDKEATIDSGLNNVNLNPGIPSLFSGNSDENGGIDSFPDTDVNSALDNGIADKKAVDSGMDAVDLSSCSFSSYNDRNHETNCSLESFPIDQTTEGKYVAYEKAKIDTQSQLEGDNTRHSEGNTRTHSVHKIIETLSESMDDGVVWYSVELPNIFR